MLFLEHKKTYRLIKGEVPDEPYEVPIGPADVKREGDDLTVVAYGLMLHLCLEAAGRLAGRGRRLGRGGRRAHDRPARQGDDPRVGAQDGQGAWSCTRTTGRTAPAPRSCATIAEECMFDLDAPVVRIGGPDVPAMPFAGPLEHVFMPDADRVYDRMLELASF